MTRNLLFVTWQDAESRRIVPIGRLLQRAKGYEFAYVNAVAEARKLGFEPLLTFPDLNEVYESVDLPPILSNRLMPSGRPEFSAYLAELGLSLEHAEPFSVLSRSGGRRATDRLEVFAPPDKTEHGYEGLFLMRGVRHVPGSEAALSELAAESRLFVMADFQNEANPHALALRDAAKRLLGYVPDYLANELASADAHPSLMEIRVERLNLPPAPVQHRLLCRFCVPDPIGDRLFRGESFRPVSQKATASAA
jgi:hypothetical protein